MKSKTTLAIATLALPLLAGAAQAQVPLTPRALGMGGAYTAVARGHEAIYLNPANLAAHGSPFWSLAFPQVAVGGSVLGLSAGDLPDLLELNKTPDARRAELLAAVPASGSEARFDIRLPLMAFQSGGFGMGVSYGSVGQHTVGKDILELLLNGYEEGRTDYAVGNTAGSRATFWDFAAAYGRAFGPVSVGVTGHFVHGGTVLRSRLFEPRVDLERREIEVDYVSVMSRGGRGYGVDLGITYHPTRSVTLSGAVANAWSRMKWNETLRTRHITLSRSDFDNASFDLLTRYERSEVDVDPDAVPLAVYATAEGLYDHAYFPAVARLGAAWKSSYGTDLSASFQEQLTEGRLADRWSRMAAIGVQQKLPLITVRAGYASNLEDGSLVSGGLTLGPMQLGLARLNDGQLEGATRSGWIGSFGVGVRTTGSR